MRQTLRIALLLALVSAVAWGEEPHRVSKLGNVVWNPWTHTLKWKTEDGRLNEKGDWKKTGETEYLVDFHQKVMLKNGKNPLPFSANEAETMDGLLEKLASQYAADSVEWYERGGKPEQKPTGQPARGRRGPALRAAAERAAP